MNWFFFFATFFISTLFSSRTDTKDNISNSVYTHSDTARVDSIVRHIEGILADQKGGGITKKFACKSSSDSGEVTVFYLDDTVLSITVNKCEADHGVGSFQAEYIDGKLVCYSEPTFFGAFENAYRADSSFDGMLNETNIFVEYFDRGIKVKELHGHPGTGGQSIYFFNNCVVSSESREKEMQRWIDFVHSKKSYTEFFQNKNHH
jgi:hypothetical protein